MHPKIEDTLQFIRDEQSRLGVERDRIQDMIDELKDLREVCDEAYDGLEIAREALSKEV